MMMFWIGDYQVSITRVSGRMVWSSSAISLASRLPPHDVSSSANGSEAIASSLLTSYFLLIEYLLSVYENFRLQKYYFIFILARKGVEKCEYGCFL